jgi:hypothetical protein
MGGVPNPKGVGNGLLGVGEWFCWNLMVIILAERKNFRHSGAGRNLGDHLSSLDPGLRRDDGKT